MAALEIKQLLALVAVVEEQSFEKAALRLHVTQSAISQRIKQLEEQLGQPLLKRGTPMVVTASGQKVLRYAKQVELLQGELLQELGYGELKSTRLSIAINADSLAAWFLEAIQPLIEQQDLLIELKVDDQEKTHEFLKSGEVLGCISSSDSAMQGCDCQYLGDMRYLCVASERFYQRYFPQGVSAAAFKQAPAVDFSHSDEMQSRYLARYFQLQQHDYPQHHIPSSEKYVEFIGRGLAWGLVPEMQFQQFSRDYELRDINPGKAISVPLYWHSWNVKSSLIAQLSETLQGYAQKALR
ncbi:LysR family transcriptional regulator ArgP [Dasania sp. GY-MA-18]|uniref:LysR family transcriptional regulator ArgP n=1 Tax=Dasania phycosphaerae TaxID=2950436 RepID=A0A9J6RKD5_9GAMM|nr:MULTISPECIES: LysR family transcriptional regulator ArgP [Dasania]MCR8922260.1 LysR family transcriptional regulator ArgP [Dasania sp. GY-MA-18]MCZ0864688.1 LysR family transcriptional regulator ArgP [Dasania phycosphaerae]MCZ0868416.1 LysR family transcriptional regulator ArgP [Dasania phycosphaerae]